MRKTCFTFMLSFLLAGCGTHEKLPAQKPADFVRITTLAGFPELPRREIREKERVAALVAFVNSLPKRWSIPWYGPPVGRVYFEFVSAKRSAGNFYVGADFFGRDTDRHYSQDASRERIVELGKIVGVDIWGYVNGRGPGPSPEPAAAPVAPAARQPTRHP
jgi:hypothetical protein